MDQRFLRGKRTGLDLDGDGLVTQFKLLKAYLEAQHLLGLPVLVERSNKGYHVKVATGFHSFALRHRWGDDPVRLEFDEERANCPIRASWTDTLFEWKDGFRVYPVDPLSLPFWVPRQIDRRRRLP